MAAFADRLAAAVRRCGNPVVVGLDPRVEQLPPGLAPGRLQAASPQAAAAAVYGVFCQGIIDVVAPLVPAVKPQSAFFEQLGVPGLLTLAQTIRYARSKGLLVIVDAKRHDIGTTAEAYADAYLGGNGSEEQFRGDALTVGPYLGEDSLEPFVKTAIERESGLFVLVKTSNPGSQTFQDLICNGRPLYRHVADLVARLSQKSQAACGYGAIGAVVGATYPKQLAELRAAMPQAWMLVPGYGSQGGTARDVVGAFDTGGLGALVNNSRGIIFAHARGEYARFGASRWQAAVEAATRDMISQLRSEISSLLN